MRIFRSLRDFLGRAVRSIADEGLAAFPGDATLAGTLDELYEAVASGSFLAIDFDAEELRAYPEALAMLGPDAFCGAVAVKPAGRTDRHRPGRPAVGLHRPRAPAVRAGPWPDRPVPDRCLPGPAGAGASGCRTSSV